MENSSWLLSYRVIPIIVVSLLMTLIMFLIFKDKNSKKENEELPGDISACNYLVVEKSITYESGCFTEHLPNRNFLNTRNTLLFLDSLTYAYVLTLKIRDTQLIYASKNPQDIIDSLPAKIDEIKAMYNKEMKEKQKEIEKQRIIDENTEWIRKHFDDHAAGIKL